MFDRGIKLVISQQISVKVNGKTQKRYKELGYPADKVGGTIFVNYTDLSRYSEEKITLQCDYCGKVYQKQYSDYFKTMQLDIKKDACMDCKVVKARESMLMKHGVDNPFKLQEFQEKAKSTILRKYGVSNVSQSQEIQEKIKSNNMEKYGVPNASSLDSTKEKVKQTNNKRFGVDYPMQTDWFQRNVEATCMKTYGCRRPVMSEHVKSKIAATCMERYGVENPLLSDAIKKKCNLSKFHNGTQTSSKAQRYLCNLFNGELNYPCGRFYIDIAIVADKIAIEYNGSGHDLSVRLGHISESNFLRNENYRKRFLHENDWRIITLSSKTDKLCSDDILLFLYESAINELNNGRHWVEINLDTYELTTSKKTIILHKSA